MYSFRTFLEKIFDGQFIRKSPQDEALEVLQTFGKMVDSRKVRDNRITLRKNVYALVKRPMTAKNTGYIIVKVTEDDTDVMQNNEVSSKVIWNYGGNDFSKGDNIHISIDDVYAVSEDNKRFYIVYPPAKSMNVPLEMPSDDDEKYDDENDNDDEKDNETKQDKDANAFLSKIKSAA